MEIMWFGMGIIGFWVVVAVISLVILACVEFEKTVLSGFILVATITLLHFATGGKLLGWVADNPWWLTLLLIAGYFLIGTIWSIAKWAFYVYGVKAQFEELREHIEKMSTSDQHGVTVWYRNKSIYLGQLPLKARDYKWSITTWILYWPWSFIWTMIDEPVKKLLRAIYNGIKGLLDGISARAFKNLEFKSKVPPADNDADNGLMRLLKNDYSLDDKDTTP